MTTALIIKRILSIPISGLHGFINSVYKLALLAWSFPHYSCINKRVKTTSVSLRAKTKRPSRTEPLIL
ncbi:transposase [Candidatus Enterovibrio altilux]|uniref:transposase n=1 Tax=Candidatus Enterovibrio altilux TaxID=1927128 RepID=UPI001CC23BA3